LIRIRGLNHIHLRVRDLDRSVRFYTRAFGLREKFREGESLVFLGTPGGFDTITLNQEAGPAGDMGGVLHFGFALAEGQGLDAAVEEVERAGGRLIDRGEHAPGMPYAYVADPDGYVIEL